MNDVAALKGELLGRSGSGARFGLDRVREAAAALGHPERGLSTLHVAGTNGKGSVVAMASAAAIAHGLQVGTFTSPHLHRLEERIRIDGAPIGEAAFANALRRVLDPAIPWTTFFEAITLTAFVAFHQAAVDLAVIEVGLGGRLDATRIIDPPLATAIVSVDLDHQRILGPDVATIAREKAGIFRAGVPVVLGPLDPQARASALEVAVDVAAGPVAIVGEDIRVTNASPLVVQDGEEAIAIGDLGLAGEHQRTNAAVAVGLLRRLPPPLQPTPAAIAEGLMRARWPGRLERLTLPEGDVVVFDCAHNPAGARALANALGEERFALVFGVMGDKPWEAMLDTLAPLALACVYVAPPITHAPRKPLPPRDLAARHPGHVADDVDEALRIARERGEGTVVVAGSIFLVAATRGALLDQPRDVLLPL